MKYVCEDSLNNFKFWQGGKDTADDLTREELETLESLIVEFFGEEIPTDTEINDFFWFARDSIAEWLGYTNWEDLENNRE